MRHRYNRFLGYNNRLLGTNNRLLLLDRVLLVPKPVISETWRLHFGTLGDPFSDPGVPRDTLGVQISISMDLGWILGPSWDHIGVTLVTCWWFGGTKITAWNGGHFFVILGVEYCSNLMAGCAETMVNTRCFARCFRCRTAVWLAGLAGAAKAEITRSGGGKTWSWGPLTNIHRMLQGIKTWGTEELMNCRNCNELRNCEISLSAWWP